MKKLSLLVLLISIFSNLGNVLLAQEEEKNTHPGKFYTIEKKYENSRVDGYNLYIPGSYTEESNPFPVIVFLQGGLGVGGRVDAIFNWELPKELKESEGINNELDELKLNTFIYIMPHISQGQFYENTDAIGQIIAEVTNTYNVDDKRIYLTGLSRGGHGAWGVASRMPEKFAAIAPICGASHGIENYEGLINLPIWTAHNISDGVVDYRQTKKIIKKIEQLSGSTFHRTKRIQEAEIEKHDQIFTSGENQNKDHDAWTEVYNETKFYYWLLRFKKG